MYESLEAYQNLVSAHPNCLDAWYEYAWLLRRCGSPERALACYARALELDGEGGADIHTNRAVILSEDLANPSAAKLELELALSKSPAFLPARFNLGKLHEDLGEPDSAADLYLGVFALGAGTPLGVAALARLVQIEIPKNATPDRLRALQSAATCEAIPAETRAEAWFALGRCLEACQQFDDAFDAFDRGNRLTREGGAAYQAVTLERHVDKMLTADAYSGPTARTEHPLPLFICGMFRSGSTLLEQILNAHPRVVAGGELPYFPRQASGRLAKFAAGNPLENSVIHAVREQYFEILRRAANASSKDGALFTTDKRPDNILLLALIKRLLPEARVIITKRDPMDVGLSVFQQHLSQSQAPYNSRLDWIGHFQGQVHRISEHFRKSDPDHVRVVDYDALVKDPESVLRPLLGWLGLEWSERCLRFHEQRNLVATASFAQVRRPLYRESSGRSRHYARHLAPLAEALARAGVPVEAPD